jgi:hypothetical protein
VRRKNEWRWPKKLMSNNIVGARKETQKKVAAGSGKGFEKTQMKTQVRGWKRKSRRGGI